MILTVNILEDNGLDTLPTTLSVPIGGIDVDGVSNTGITSSFSTTIDNNSSVIVTIIVGGYHNYSTTISSVFTANKSIDIVLVPSVINMLSIDYNRPVPRFFSFISPCGLIVYTYSASSFSGEESYYLNNDLVAEGTNAIIKVCSPGEYQIKQRSVTYRVIPGCPNELLWDRQWANLTGETGNTTPGVISGNYLEEDTYLNTIIPEYRPIFLLDVSVPINQTELCCYTREEVITVSAIIDITRENSTLSDYTIEFNLISPSDVEVFSQLTDLDLGELSVEFPLLLLGKYTVIATLVDTVCNIAYTNKVEINSCNFITITTDNCNEFILNNVSQSTNTVVSIDNITGVNVLTNVPLLAGEALTTTFADISLYIATIQYSAGNEVITEQYIINNYCGLDDCLGNYIMTLLCGEKDRCSPCPVETELNQMLLLHYAYYMKLNKEFSFNNFYSALSTSKLAELTNLKQIMDKLMMYCKRKDCTTISKTQSSPYTITSSSNGCTSCG